MISYLETWIRNNKKQNLIINPQTNKKQTKTKVQMKMTQLFI